MSNSEAHDQRASGRLTMEISNLVVRLYSEYTGRGPTKARTTIRDEVVVCIAQESFTKAERRLVEAGENELVVGIRRRFPSTMRDDLVGGVEMLTGRKVVSFLSDHDARTDHACEVFVLDGSPEAPSDDG